MWIIVIIPAVLTLIALLRVKAYIGYEESGVMLELEIGPFCIFSYPRKAGSKKETAVDRKKKKEAEDKKRRAGGPVKNFWPLLKFAVELAGKIKRKLTIDDLTVYFMSGGEDPAKAALNFGYASAGLGAVTAVFENNFNIKRRDIRTAVSFGEIENYIYVRAQLSMALGAILFLAVWVLIQLYKRDILKTKNRKVEHHGKSSDRRSDGSYDAEN